MSDGYLSAKTAAAYLDAKPRGFDQFVRKHGVPYVLYGRCRRFKRVDLDRALKTLIRTQKVVIECHGDEWWVMLNDGTVQVLGSPEAAHKAMQQAAALGNKTATITTVEWRNVPDGFKPPKGR